MSMRAVFQPRAVLLTLAGLFVVAALLAFGSRGCASSSSLASFQVGRIDDERITESSGLVASRQYPGVFWTHNDQGSDPVIFAIDRAGRLLARFTVDAANHDWEDIATDDQGFLYIADTGNNNARKKKTRVFRVREPDPRRPDASAQPLAVDREWNLRFPERPFDCESLFVHGSSGYLVSKHLDYEPAAIYTFSLLQDSDRLMPLENVATLPVHSPVTGADISPDGLRLAVVSHESLDVFLINGRPASASTGPRSRLRFQTAHDIESCCFVPGGVLATSETRQVYFFPDSAFMPPIQPANGPATNTAADVAEGAARTAG